jgi:hypothetical protein
MRKDPDKYSHLIHNNNTSTTPSRTQATDYNTASYGQQQPYLSRDYISVLIEEAEKLYDNWLKS